MVKPHSSLHFLWISVVIIGLDQVSKWLISTYFQLYESREILPVFNLILAHNPGAAFSFLAGAGGWQRWLFSFLAIGVSGVLIIWLHRLTPVAILEALGISLILGGAIGNVFDRISLGYVIDFIQIHWHEWYFPAFNVADTAITCGAGCLILEAVLPKKITALSNELLQSHDPDPPR